MTVKELTTLLLMLDPQAEVVMWDSGAPVEAWEDDSNWTEVTGVESPQETTYFSNSAGPSYGYMRGNVVRLKGLV